MPSDSHPDTGDTAALDDLLDDWYLAGIAFGKSCSARNEDRVDTTRAAIHAHVEARVQAEREECATIAVTCPGPWHLLPSNIARAIRARSTSEGPVND